MLIKPRIEEPIPMPSSVVDRLRAITQVGLPAGAPESFDALVAVYEIAFLCGQNHESRKQQERFDAIRKEVTPAFLRRQVG